LNEIEYNPGIIKEYEKDVWRQGICPGLAKVSFLGDQVIFTSSGHVNLAEYVKNNPQKTVTSKACRVISALRKIIESKISADDYLISENSIALDLDKIWINSIDGRVKLLPFASKTSFFDEICSICDQIGAENVKERLISQNKLSVMSEMDLLRYLSLFELELRQ